MYAHNPSSSLTIPPELLSRNLNHVFGLGGATPQPAASPAPINSAPYNGMQHHQSPIAYTPDITQPVQQIFEHFQQHVPSNYIASPQQAQHMSSILAAAIPSMPSSSKPVSQGTPKPNHTTAVAKGTSGSLIKNASPVTAQYKSFGPCMTPPGLFKHSVDIGQSTILGSAPFSKATPELFESIDLDEIDLSDMDPIWADIARIAGGCTNIHNGQKYLKHPRRGVMLIPKLPRDSQGNPIPVGNLPYSKLKKLDPNDPKEAAEIATYRRLTQEILPYAKFASTPLSELPKARPAAPPPIQAQQPPMLTQPATFQPMQQFAPPNHHSQPYPTPSQPPQFAVPQQTQSFAPAPVPSIPNQPPPAPMQPAMQAPAAQAQTTPGPEVVSDESDSDSSEESEYETASSSSDNSDSEQEYDDVPTARGDKHPKQSDRHQGRQQQQSPFGQLPQYGFGLNESENSTLAMLRHDAMQKRKAKIAQYNELYAATEGIDSQNRVPPEDLAEMTTTELQALIKSLTDDFEFHTTVWQNVLDICGTWIPCSISSANHYLAGNILDLQSTKDKKKRGSQYDDDDGSGSDDDRQSGTDAKTPDYVDDMRRKMAAIKYQVRREWEKNNHQVDWLSIPLITSMTLFKNTVNHHLSRRYSTTTDDTYSKAGGRFLSTVSGSVSPAEETCLTHPAVITSQKKYREPPSKKSKRESQKARSTTETHHGVGSAAASATPPPTPPSSQAPASMIPTAAVASSASTHAVHQSLNQPPPTTTSQPVAAPSASIESKPVPRSLAPKTSSMSDPKVQSRLDRF